MNPKGFYNLKRQKSNLLAGQFRSNPALMSADYLLTCESRILFGNYEKIIERSGMRELNEKLANEKSLILNKLTSFSFASSFAQI